MPIPLPRPSDRLLRPGEIVTRRSLTTATGATVTVPGNTLTHLQFRRFAGCPVCNLHLRSITRRHDEIAAANVAEVVVFHSSASELLPQTHDLPFAVIADPDKRLYIEFGVESSPRSLLDPRAWWAIVRGTAVSLVAMVRKQRPAPSLMPHGGRFGLPADFLIAEDGRILACKYGEHADDQWSVDELITLSRRQERDVDRFVARQ